MPFEALVQPAVETDEGTVETAPKEDRPTVLKTIEDRFKELLPEDDVEYIMGSIREAAGQTRPGRGRR